MYVRRRNPAKAVQWFKMGDHVFVNALYERVHSDEHWQATKLTDNGWMWGRERGTSRRKEVTVIPSEYIVEEDGDIYCLSELEFKSIFRIVDLDGTIVSVTKQE